MPDTTQSDALYLEILLLLAYSIDVAQTCAPEAAHMQQELRDSVTDALLHVAEGLAWEPDRASSSFRTALAATYRVGAILDILKLTDVLDRPEHERGMRLLKPVIKGLKSRALFP